MTDIETLALEVLAVHKYFWSPGMSVNTFEDKFESLRKKAEKILAPKIEAAKEPPKTTLF